MTKLRATKLCVCAKDGVFDKVVCDKDAREKDVLKMVCDNDAGV